MAFSLEALYAFFSPSASRDASPQGSPSFFSSTLFTAEDSITTNTKQTDLPLPPSSAFTASNMPSRVESATAIPLSGDERDFAAPMSPYLTHRSGSMSSTSTGPSSSSDLLQDDDNTGRPTGPHHTATSAAVVTQLQSHADLQPPQERPSPLRRSATDVGPLEPLSRTFPAPTHEPSLEELLARKPAKWSLGHYVKNARVREATAAAGVEDQEQRARKFEDIKRELLLAKGAMEGLGKKGE
ncbi:hypothetical protein BT67DRAFT_372777 [Trichocladium antarcticum]|uniref:Uncharacterized protein n=1 Tax=Trichocladium antarcticum TaxID=1450529 RepID=A0AAN6UQN7_9PEZI|nr:hypothetical protein BT67DRAFT_372777 [Trichocladium antarcticum]